MVGNKRARRQPPIHDPSPSPSKSPLTPRTTTARTDPPTEPRTTPGAIHPSQPPPPCTTHPAHPTHPVPVPVPRCIIMTNRSIVLTLRPHISPPSLPTFALSRSLIRKLKAHRTGGFEVVARVE